MLQRRYAPRELHGAEQSYRSADKGRELTNVWTILQHAGWPLAMTRGDSSRTHTFINILEFYCDPIRATAIIGTGFSYEQTKSSH